MEEREGRRSVRARERDREAVGGELEHRDAGLVAPEPIAGPAPRTGCRLVHSRRVHLAIHRDALWICPHLGTQAAPVLLDVRVERRRSGVQGSATRTGRC